MIIVGTVPKYNRNIVETAKIDTPNIQIHDQSLLQWYRNFNEMLARLSEFY